MRDGEIDDDDFSIVRSRRKEKNKVNVVISKPMTRSQENKVGFDAGMTMPPGKPNSKTHSPKCKKK